MPSHPMTTQFSNVPGISRLRHTRIDLGRCAVAESEKKLFVGSPLFNHIQALSAVDDAGRNGTREGFYELVPAAAFEALVSCV